MNFQEPGVLCQGRPSLVINHFVLEELTGSTGSAPRCLLCRVQPGASISRTRAALATSSWPNVMAENGYGKWLPTHL